jgi:hypothetical protein
LLQGIIALLQGIRALKETRTDGRTARKIDYINKVIHKTYNQSDTKVPKNGDVMSQNPKT